MSIPVSASAPPAVRPPFLNALVHFRALSDDDIQYYVDTFRPYDKAGAYGIQEWIGMVGIDRIDGCYYNVMGLPTTRLYQELKKGF